MQPVVIKELPRFYDATDLGHPAHPLVRYLFSSGAKEFSRKDVNGIHDDPRVVRRALVESEKYGLIERTGDKFRVEDSVYEHTLNQIISTTLEYLFIQVSERCVRGLILDAQATYYFDAMVVGRKFRFQLLGNLFGCEVRIAVNPGQRWRLFPANISEGDADAMFRLHFKNAPISLVYGESVVRDENFRREILRSILDVDTD